MASNNGAQRELSVGVVGAGFGGVGIGIKLREAGIENFTIFERGESVGGVWRANTYPGAACDVPSHLYSFSFAPGHHWSRRYAPQPEILRYLDETARDFGITPHIRLGTEVTEASFDPETGHWTLRTDDGDRHGFDLLVTACGQLTRPAVPKLEGIDGFDGPVFHSAEWDHEVDLEGKRVAVIGTGASAIQFIPEVAKIAGSTAIYQRSAPWIMPKSDRLYPEWERRVFKRFPLRVAAARLGMFAFFEMGTYGFTGHNAVLKPFQMVADRERNRQLGHDPELLAKATPDYTIGCKRVLLTSDWYPTLLRDDVELITTAVERVTANAIVDADGVERETDVVIWGTGFESHNFVAPMDVHGLDGRVLNAVWGERAEAFLGTTVSGFPNMFVLYGPNTNHGSGSVPYTLESQFNYILDAIRRLREGGFKWIDLRAETQERWRAEIADRSERTVWTSGGCGNWYVNSKGENTNNWPGPWLEYRRRTRKLNPGDYRVAV
jgi:cation diffusion facilitator CzcD-associated flavoprotein CzcO